MKKLKTEYKILGSFFALTLLSGATLSSSFASADSGATVNLSLTVPTSCSLSLVNGTNNVETLSKSINAGIRDTIGTANLKALCNDSGGFAVYAVGYTGDTYGETDLVANDNSGNVIETGYTASNPTDSEWYMSLAAVSGTYAPTIPDGTGGLENFTTNHVIPSVYTKVAYRNSGTDVGNNAAGANFTATFGAYIAPAQPAGIYEGKVKFLLVHPNVTSAASNTLLTMQSVGSWGSSVGSGETVTAMDERDGEEYTVARLADNNIWMTKNLRLDLSKANITAENTNNPSLDFLSAASNKPTTASDWCINDAAECTDQIRYSTINIGNTTVDSNNHSYDEYGVYYNWYTATAGNGTTFSPNYETDVAGDICPSGWHLPSGTITSYGSPSSWTGNYWNLGASTAGLTTVTDSDHTTITGATNSARWQASPVNFTLSGIIPSYQNQLTDNSIHDRNDTGYYWTSTARSSSSPGPRVMLINASSIAPGLVTSIYKASGLAVRCIANPGLYPLTVNYDEHTTNVVIDRQTVADGESILLPENVAINIRATFEPGYVIDEWSTSSGFIDNIAKRFTTYTMSARASTLTVSSKAQNLRYMQDVATWKNSVGDGQTTTAIDIRDDSEYTVARLADGNLWMTKNLRLNLSNADVTAGNTNHPTNNFVTAVSNDPKASSHTWCNSTTAECDRIEYSDANIGNLATDGFGHTYDEYGIYYNWYTATAGNGTFNTETYYAVQGDICPSGWHLPTSDNTRSGYAGDFHKLAVAVDGSGSEYNYSTPVVAGRMLTAPNNFSLSGSLHSTANGGINIQGRGDRGAYWTAVKRDSNTYAYYWFQDDSDMHLRNYGDGQINYGNSIRCLAD